MRQQANRQPAAAAAPQRTFLGHPPGLYVLFLTQMWERFSYFGMLALLIIYLNQYFKLPQSEASTVFKWYTSLIYFTPLLGGYLADRFLGNKRAVAIGAVLMAIGHFLMAFPALAALYGALVFLVVGCGLLTPPLTTQVGLLYPPHDARRDSAYTLFYMGINLGAFASPLLCGWLVENTRGRFHSGFTLAGIGMVLALVTYLVGLRWVVELDQGSASRTPDSPAGSGERPTEAAGPKSPSVLPRVNRLAPGFLAFLGGLLALAAPVLALAGWISWDTVLAFELAAVCALVFAGITAAVAKRLRDQVLAILLLAVFAIFYWAGAGQSGNAINLWAEQNTDRFLSQPAPPPDLFPEAVEASDATAEEPPSGSWWERWGNLFRLLPRKQAEGPASWGEWWASLWNPVPTAWFQAINPLLILLLAPPFALLWTWLGRRGLNPSIPTKMALGLLLMALALVLMAGGGWREAQTSSVPLRGAGLPAPLVVNGQGQICRTGGGMEPEPYDAGRLFYDRSSQSLRAVGVLPDLVRDEIVRDTVSADFVQRIEELQKRTVEAAAGAPGWTVAVQLDRDPPGFDLRYAGFGKPAGNKEVHYDPASRMLTAAVVLEEKGIQGLRVAAGDPALRATLDELMVKANTHRISPGWLFGFFLLATLGELCLSPVGLSMVSQLAPARFATLLMGVWLLTFSFGNFLAGAFGERWGSWAPVPYFMVIAAALGAAAFVLLVLVRKVRALMHGVE